MTHEYLQILFGMEVFAGFFVFGMEVFARKGITQREALERLTRAWQQLIVKGMSSAGNGFGSS
jgi:hypothetical protein